MHLTHGRTVIYPHNLSALLHSELLFMTGQCQSFLGRVPTRWSSRWNVLLPPPSLRYADYGHMFATSQGGVALFTLKFPHPVLSKKTGDRRSSQSALRNSPARPIRSSQIWDLCD